MHSVGAIFILSDSEYAPDLLGARGVTNPGAPILDRRGNFFATNCAPDVRTKCARIHMRPRAGTEGAEERSGGVLRLCCRAVRVSIVESRTAGAEQRPRQKRDPETVFLGVALGVSRDVF